MEDAIKEMKRAIRNYILENNYDEIDEDARIEKFWQDLGDNFFSDEAIERFLLRKGVIEKVSIRKQRAAKAREEFIIEKLKTKRDELRREKLEIGEEAFLEKYPPLTFEEKREKMAEIIRNKRLERNATKGKKYE